MGPGRRIANMLRESARAHVSAGVWCEYARAHVNAYVGFGTTPCVDV